MYFQGKISEIWQNLVSKKKHMKRNSNIAESEPLLQRKTILLSFSSQWDELSIWASDRLVQHLQDFTRGVTYFHIIISIIITIIKYQRKLHRSRGVKHSHQHRQFTTVWHQSATSSQRVHLFCSVHHGWCKFAAWKRAR